VGPEAQLEFEAARGGLFADESQHFEIAVAFGIRQAHGPDIVTRDGNQERVGEKEIGFGDGLATVVAQPQGEAETVESLRGQHGEIARPEFAVLEPGLVFHIAAEQAGDAAGGVGGALDDGLGDGERGHGIGRELHPVGKFEKGVDQSAGIVTGGQQDGSAGGLAGEQSESFGNCRDAGARVLEDGLGHGRRGARGEHAQVAGGRLGYAVRQARGHATRRQRLLQLRHGPARRRRAGYRVVGIDHQGNVPGGALGTATKGGGRTYASEKVAAGETRGVHGANCSGARGITFAAGSGQAKTRPT
jgi:hypothetical protein